ncbi:unnamed protein product, partial [Ectocarpus sp. 8 AP-2014]
VDGDGSPSPRTTCLTPEEEAEAKATARVLLSVPASSAVLERDFSTAGRLITGARSCLSAAYVEMVLVLNGNQEYIR